MSESVPPHSFYGFSASQDTPLFVGPSDGYVYQPPQNNPNSKSASIDQLLNEIEREYSGEPEFRYAQKYTVVLIWVYSHLCLCVVFSPSVGCKFSRFGCTLFQECMRTDARGEGQEEHVT